jgi:hypothetical protein
MSIAGQIISNEDFEKLERYEDGSIVNFEEVFYVLTEGQVDRLADDDYSRYLEEMENLLYEDYSYININ